MRPVTERPPAASPVQARNPRRHGQTCDCGRGGGLHRAGLTAIRDAHWPHRQTGTIPVSRDIVGSTAHSGSHASTVGPPRCPRTAQIWRRGPEEYPFRGNHAVPGWGTRSAPPSGTRVASDPISASEIRPSCPPAIMADAVLDAKPLFGFYGTLSLIQRQKRFFSVIGCGSWSRMAISSHV